MTEIDVRLERVTKSFADVTAVDDMSIEIADGEFFSLLGPSGCGKTTTLRMIGGFEDPTFGTVYLRDVDVTNLPPYKRDVNTVFQSYALFPHLDIQENVAFGLRRKRVDKSEMKKRVAEALELVEMTGYEHRRPGQLSGGQQQRVALARALVNSPQVLLLDEPLGALDLKLRKQMQLELKRIQLEVGITFIYVTHDQEEAMTMSNRLAVMRLGHVEQIGAPEDVYENPATEFVAGFLGASNLLDGRVAAKDGDMATLDLDVGVVVQAPADRVKHSVGSTVKVGVRPEKISLSKDTGEAPANRNSVTGVLELSAYIGVSNQYKINGPGETVLTVYAQNLGDEEIPQPGDKVRLSWRPEHTFVVTPAEVPISDEEEVVHV